ncbi:unnamed protein product [Soboliphyme baturini]|uniref:WD_REPEATS_REGION domain-containing protein n=1 Tax=Soboliphyme baturini TaxID=241478 RepID=A0A183J140_9BILA|nr:unnamed protein product [Soboliphyme baturini]
MGYVDTMFGHTDTVCSIDCLSRERAVTCGSRDRTVRIWKIPEESQLIFRAHRSLSVWSVFKKKPTCVKYGAHENTMPNNGPTENWISSICSCSYTDLIFSGSCDEKLRFWKCSTDFKHLDAMGSYHLPGFINDLACDKEGKTIICAVGPEHKNGRWWKLSLHSSVVVIPLVYTSS